MFQDDLFLLDLEASQIQMSRSLRRAVSNSTSSEAYTIHFQARLILLYFVN